MHADPGQAEGQRQFGGAGFGDELDERGEAGDRRRGEAGAIDRDACPGLTVHRDRQDRDPEERRDAGKGDRQAHG